MSVMDLYAPRSMGQLPAPPGTNLPPGFPPFADLVKQLGLPTVGLFTPWAARTSGVDWQDVKQPPDTNVAAFNITDAAIQAAQLAAMGQALPFVAVLSSSPSTPDQIKSAFRGTPYGFYETQAVYSQDDPADPPKPLYMHWLQRRSPGDPDDGNGSTEQAAKNVGTLIYAFPVNYNSTAKRKPPSLTFSLIIGGGGVPPLMPGDITPPPGPLPSPITPPPAAGWGIPALVGAGVALATFFAVREYRAR